MLLFVDHEIEFVRDERHLTLVVLDIVVLHLLEQLLHARLAEELDERLVFRIPLERSEKEDTSIFLVTLGDELLRFVKQLVYKGFLCVVETLHIWFELHELLVLALWHRT